MVYKKYPQEQQKLWAIADISDVVLKFSTAVYKSVNLCLVLDIGNFHFGAAGSQFQGDSEKKIF